MRIKIVILFVVFALVSACSAEGRFVGDWRSSTGSTFVFHDDGRYEQIGVSGAAVEVGEWWVNDEGSGLYTDYKRGHSSHPMHWQLQEDDLVFRDHFSGGVKYRLSKN